jgi:hypothetical protein
MKMITFSISVDQRKYLGPSQGDLQPTGADTVSIINERMSSVINAWETGVYFHFNPIQIKLK